jgi:hypothetical protein
MEYKISKDYCNNCGRKSHCGTELSEDFSMLAGSSSIDPILIRVCRHCNCGRCLPEDKNTNEHKDPFNGK